MTKYLPKTVVTICGLLPSILPTYADSPAKPAFGATAMWESKYVSEGRDNLDDGGILSFEGTAEWWVLTAGAWFATGDSESYEELNLYVEYGLELGPVGAYIGYTRLEFLGDDESDNEVTTGIAVNSITYVTPALEYTYSTESEGGFLELSLRSEIELLDGQLALEPYVLEGLDFGYASEEYDGPNNLQLGLDFSFGLTDAIRIVGSVSHSWAHEDVENDGLGDVSWGNIGLSAEF